MTRAINGHASARYARMLDYLRRARGEHLLTSSLWIALNTAALGLFGFAFWLACAHLYTAAEVGAGSAIISASNLISLCSFLGFNTAFLRYLPGADAPRRSAIVDTGLVLACACSVVLSLAYVALIPVIAPDLTFVRADGLLLSSFILLTAAATGNGLTDSVFIAYRSAYYNVGLDGILQSGVKLALAFLLIVLSSAGIFYAYGVAACVAFALSIIILIRRFQYRPSVGISRAAVRQIWSFSASSYVGYLLNVAPVLAIPLIVIRRFGTAQAGYFYLAFMCANMIYTVAYSVSTSMIAEVGYAERTLHALVYRAAKILLVLIIPSSALLGGLASFILSLFGKEYGRAASRALIVLASGGLLVAVYDLINAVLRASHRLYAYMGSSCVYCVLLISAAALIPARLGLVGIALAWPVASSVGAIAGSGLWWLSSRRRELTRTGPAGSSGSAHTVP